MTDGLWDGELIATTLVDLGLSAGADADLPEPVRFVRRVREVLLATASQHGGLARPAVFLFTPSLSDDVAAKGSLHRRIHTGRIDVTGHVWLVGAAVTTGYSVPLTSDEADEIFDFVCGTLELGDAPAVFCDTSTDPNLFAWYPLGLADDDKLYEGPVVQSTVPSLDELLEIVDRVHQTRLKTSFRQNIDTTLWQDGSKHWAHKRAERRVQDALLSGLGGAFARPYFVEQELPGDSGRFDIGFRKAIAPGTTALLAILELKVARSYGSTGAAKSSAENEQHAVDGVEQAWAYADEHGAPDAACLIFDLRAGDQGVIPERAAERALALEVVLKLWRCFPTAEDYRSFKVPGEIP